MKRYLDTLFRAIMAGVAIGIGGVAYLSSENLIVGSVMFSVGLYLICTQELNLFTGKVGYVVNDHPNGWLGDLLTIWRGNLYGTFLTAGILRLTRNHTIVSRAVLMCEAKLNDTYLSLFLLAVFCGVLVYAAVDGFKKTNNPLILILCVAAFVLCGFEHCIADMFYFAFAKMWTWDALIRVLIITIGNMIGGVMIPLSKQS